jgi:hypothetical protein
LAQGIDESVKKKHTTSSYSKRIIVTVSLDRLPPEVIITALSGDDWVEAVRTGKAEYGCHHPDVPIGSPRGGTVAMNLESGSTPLVALRPTW